MNEATLVALALVIFAWSVLANRLAALNLSGPLVLAAAGLLLGNPSWGVVTVNIQSSTVHHLAEITLALLLFADASAVPLNAARRELPLTARLLGIGLPLSIIGGTVVAALLFPTLPIAIAGLIAASLAPTDAALSAPVIADERLPLDVRRVLNTESGLNDGIATPVVTLCVAAAATELGIVAHEFESGFGALVELALGILVGIAVGFVGGFIVVSRIDGCGCRAVHDAWPRWRSRSSRSWSHRSSAATHSWLPSSVGWSSAPWLAAAPRSLSSSPS